jgi:hypothetical protein
MAAAGEGRERERTREGMYMIAGLDAAARLQISSGWPRLLLCPPTLASAQACESRSREGGWRVQDPPHLRLAMAEAGWVDGRDRVAV